SLSGWFRLSRQITNGPIAKSLPIVIRLGQPSLYETANGSDLPRVPARRAILMQPAWGVTHMTVIPRSVREPLSRTRPDRYMSRQQAPFSTNLPALFEDRKITR